MSEFILFFLGAMLTAGWFYTLNKKSLTKENIRFVKIVVSLLLVGVLLSSAIYVYELIAGAN
jgi:hypothetical protein